MATKFSLNAVRLVSRQARQLHTMGWPHLIVCKSKCDRVVGAQLKVKGWTNSR